jgi:twinkle protein
MKILGDTVCPGCRAHGGDSKGNHLILFEGDGGERFAKCPKCGHYEADAATLNLNKKKEWNPEELSQRLAEIQSYPIRTLETRRIDDWVCDHFGVRAGLSTSNGKDITEHYYPRRNTEGEICRYNVRVLDPKAFYSVGPAGLPFGAEWLEDKMVRRAKLWIFEDELSTMSAYKVLRQFMPEEQRDSVPATIGVIAGSGSIVATLKYLIDKRYDEKFEEIIYVHDNDKAGLESYQQGRAFYPMLRGLTTELKDANDMLMDGRNKELFKTLVRGARVRSPDGSASVSDAMRDAMETRSEGFKLPWDGLNELVNIHLGEMWSIGGGVGCGKTLLAHAIGAHLISVYKVPTALFMLEERIGKTLINVSTHITGVKQVGFNKNQQAQINEQYNLDELLHLWKNKGANDWDNISQCIRYYAGVHGVKVFFIDNVTALTNTLSPSEINTEIARIATEAHGLCDELNITIMLFSHLNPPSSGPSHEEGGETRPAQFTGSRALMRWSEVMVGFERNLYAEGEGKHFSKIRVLKDRENGRTGVINCRYDLETGRLAESEPYVSSDDEEDERF